MSSFSSSRVEAMSRCIDQCQLTHHSCLAAAQRLLERHWNTSASKLMDGLTHCIGMTRLTAEMLLTDSGAHQEACDLCAKTCRECAEACKGDPELESCMKACLECAHCCQLASDEAAA